MATKEAARKTEMLKAMRTVRKYLTSGSRDTILERCAHVGTAFDNLIRKDFRVLNEDYEDDS